MKCTILHESKGRIRLHINNKKRMTIKEADVLSYYLNGIENVHQATVYERTCDIVVLYNDDKNAVLAALKNYNGQDEELIKQVPENTGRELNRMYQDKLVNMILFKAVRSIFLPAPIIAAYTAVKSVKYIWKGIKCLFNKKLEVEVLDAVSIGVSIARLDFSTAGSVMFLLGIGELLEEWTRKKSIDDLARCMSLNVDRVWLKKDDTEVLVPVTQVRPGDLIVVHTGNLIPLDGKVVEGEASVNQASLTGESIAVMKSNGAYVYAGTVVEEGECVICVESQQGSSRYDNIVSMIENSEKLKSATESRAINLADKLVPYSLGGTALTYLITRNATKALSILMVDFSCALKLSMPLAVLSAMRECGTYKITVKGGKYLEAVAKADTIVFDKTGTLTYASPTVADIIPFGGMDRDEVLKVAACLEEHYPHSMANAVVKEAAKEHINHEEMHSQVEYVVAHGISSIIEGKKTIIGSKHFVFEDEHATVPEGEEYKFENLPEQYSHLYLAIGGVLAGVVCISDPLREEAAAVLTSLKKLGIKKTVMMTGDNERTAAAIAKQVGVDMYYAEVLPEDKANFVESEKAEGRTVIMIGDGINDSPALSAADVGIAISDGAAIAREIADITVGADNLFELVMLKMIANGLQKRINSNYRFVIGFNSMLIALGVAGILPPATSALLHNVSTLGISVKSMTNLIE